MNRAKKVALARKTIHESPPMTRLFNQLYQREDFSLILGAGCSVHCGIPTLENLKKKVIQCLERDVLHNKAMNAEPIDVADFDRVWSNAGPQLRHTVLSNWFLKRPSHLGPYYSLANLIKAGYFKTILTYNIDCYLEVALHSAGFDDFLVLINKCEDSEYIVNIMNDKSIVKILKTHGDHRHKVYAFSEKEIIGFGEECRQVVETITAGKVLFIGYRAEDDDFVRSLKVSNSGSNEEMWFANPNPPSAFVQAVMEARLPHSRWQENWIKINFQTLLDTLYYGLSEFNQEHLQRERVRKEGLSFTAEVTIKNKLGLHGRAAAMLVKTANRFGSSISIEKDGETINGSSPMGLMMLAAGPGSKIKIHAEGNDAKEAIREIVALINRKFDEE
jgi:phosphocarrier protein